MIERIKDKFFRVVDWCYALFINRLNFCAGYTYPTGEPKPENPIYNVFYKYWLFPWAQNECLCCNVIRGLIYGVALGFILGYAIGMWY